MATENPSDQIEEKAELAILEGTISIEAALHSGSRVILSLLIRHDKNDRALNKLEQHAIAKKIPIRRVSEAEIETFASGKTHGGVVAEVGPRRFTTLENLIANVQNPWVAMIDGVEDPYNFGAAVRSLYAAGAAGLVVRPRNWMSAAATVARSSAGASELIPTAIAETALDAAQHFQQQGFMVGCASDAPEAVSLYDANLTVPLFLLIGGEKRGITRSFLDQADILLRIPYARRYSQSLGTAAASAILAFEIMRQRQGK